MRGFMLASYLIEHLQGHGVVSALKMHPRNAAIGNIDPERKAMLFAVLTGHLESFKRLVKAIHFSQDVGPPHTNSCCRRGIVTPCASLLIVGEGFGESLQA